MKMKCFGLDPETRGSSSCIPKATFSCCAAGKHSAPRLGPKTTSHLCELLAREPLAPVSPEAWRHTSSWRGRNASLNTCQAPQKRKDDKKPLILVLQFLPQVSLFCSSHLNLSGWTRKVWRPQSESSLLTASLRACTEISLPAKRKPHQCCPLPPRGRKNSK